MSEKTKQLLEGIARAMNGLNEEQADRVARRANDFIAGAAVAERRAEAKNN